MRSGKGSAPPPPRAAAPLRPSASPRQGARPAPRDRALMTSKESQPNSGQDRCSQFPVARCDLMPASRRGCRPRGHAPRSHRIAAPPARRVRFSPRSLSASAFGRGASCPQVDPYARKPPHPVAPPASSPALLLPAQASRPKTPASFSASLRIFASARPQTLCKPRQPATRTAGATCPARLAAPAPARASDARSSPLQRPSCSSCSHCLVFALPQALLKTSCEACVPRPPRALRINSILNGGVQVAVACRHA